MGSHNSLESMGGGLSRERLEALIELADCRRAERNQLLDAIRSEREIGRWRPEREGQIDPRDGMPVLYSMARARRPHDHKPARSDAASDPARCVVCRGETTGVLDVARAGPGVTFINKNLFPILYPERTRSAEVHGHHTHGRPAAGGHFLQWTSDRHDLDLHNISVAHATVVLERLAALEEALLTTSTRMPRVPSRGERPLHGYVGIIKNRGATVGGSLVHGHQQIAISNVRPQRVAQHMAFREREGKTFVEHLLAVTPPELIVSDTGDVALLTPPFLRRVLQLMAVVKNPERHYLHELTRRETRQLAGALVTACAAVSELMPELGREVGYNLVVHNGPGGGLYVELIPWTQQYGGYEQLGLFIVQGTPTYSHELVVDWLARRGA